MTRNDVRSGREVVALLGFRKYKWNIVTLIAPRVHINRCVENPEGSV
jgi:hypothetical protein